VISELCCTMYPKYSSGCSIGAKKGSKQKAHMVTEYMMYFHPLVPFGADFARSRQPAVEARTGRIGAQLRSLCLAELDGWSAGVPCLVSKV
jgi:hypothetical protein